MTTRKSGEVFALVTDLLDIEAYPALDLACAYSMRWECETVIGHHKTDMSPGMAVLRSKDPEGIAQEMWALFAVYQAIHTRPLEARSATAAGPPGPVGDTAARPHVRVEPKASLNPVHRVDRV